ncbi:hypothetical protein GCM10010327_07010 [Streptomyces nitrosporeus]|nr:hypothetical protein GCM10010327_07010 [Streptomyces nitrosporeus]
MRRFFRSLSPSVMGSSYGGVASMKIWRCTNFGVSLFPCGRDRRQRVRAVPDRPGPSWGGVLVDFVSAGPPTVSPAPLSSARP